MASPSAISSASTGSPAQQSSTNTSNNQQQQQQQLAIDLNARNLASSVQQQELIKLLAQHFQHQFYQSLAVRSEQQAYQQQQQQFAASLAGNCELNRPAAFDLGLLNQNGQPPPAMNRSQLLNGRLLINSPAEFPNTGPNSSSLYQQVVPNEPGGLLDSFASNQPPAFQPSASCPDLLANQEASLLSALGLSLTSNQLAAFHQQQQRHFQPAEKQLEPSESQLTSKGGHHQQLNQRSRPMPRAKRESQGSSEMLKFSINTILGRNSPEMSFRPAASAAAGKSIEHLNKLFGHDTSNGLFHSRPAQGQPEEEKPASPPSSLDMRLANCDEDSSRESTSTQNSAAFQSSQINRETNAINLYNHLQAAHSSAAGANLNQAPASGKLNNPNLSHQHQLPACLPNQRQLQQQHPHHHHLTPFLAGSGAFPWTVAVRGKPRRGMMRRAVFSDSQRVGLEKRFQSQKYISKPDRKKLAEKLGLRDSQVKIWFQNRRMKWRNSKERELLSAGGSREQTLPTRNNPNPDLSDVGETIKRLQTTTPVAAVQAAPPQQPHQPLSTTTTTTNSK